MNRRSFLATVFAGGLLFLRDLLSPQTRIATSAISDQQEFIVQAFASQIYSSDQSGVQNTPLYDTEFTSYPRPQAAALKTFDTSWDALVRACSSPPAIQPDIVIEGTIARGVQ